jgi:hypothetical protein
MEHFQIFVTEYPPIKMEALFQVATSQGPKCYTLHEIVQYGTGAYGRLVGKHLAGILQNQIGPPLIFELSDKEVQDFCEVASGALARFARRDGPGI